MVEAKSTAVCACARYGADPKTSENAPVRGKRRCSRRAPEVRPNELRGTPSDTKQYCTLPTTTAICIALCWRDSEGKSGVGRQLRSASADNRQCKPTRNNELKCPNHLRRTRVCGVQPPSGEATIGSGTPLCPDLGGRWRNIRHRGVAGEPIENDRERGRPQAGEKAAPADSLPFEGGKIFTNLRSSPVPSCSRRSRLGRRRFPGLPRRCGLRLLP